MTDPAAEEIADELLYLTGKAITSENFNHYKVHFQLPTILETLGGEKIIRTEDDLRVVFEQIRSHLRENDVTDLVRSVVSSEFLDSDTIGSTHVTKTVKADGSTFGAPFPSYAIICRKGRDWKFVRSCIVMDETSSHKTTLDSILAEPELPGQSGT